MKTEHTPGPWKIQPNREAGGLLHLAIVNDSGDKMPASITPMRLRRDEDDANARLIAAAPELLSALENAEHKFSLIADTARRKKAILMHHDTSFNLADYATIAQTEITRSLAKAKGEA